MTDYKFNEDKYLKEALNHIDFTYQDGKHTFELIDSSGWGDGYAIGNILKFASQYGNDGYNRDDLKKIVHYAAFQMYLHDNNLSPKRQRIELTQKRLKELITYYPETGIAYWNVNKGNNRKGKRVGNISTGGYRRVRVDGYDYRFARLVWLYMMGHFPNGKRPFIDHKFQITDDDRFEELRVCTAAENAANRRRPVKNRNTPRGVFLVESGKYRVRIQVEGKIKNLGTYDTLEKADEVYKEAAKKYHKEFRNLD